MLDPGRKTGWSDRLQGSCCSCRARTFLCIRKKPSRPRTRRIEDFPFPLPQRTFMPAFTLNGKDTTLDLPDDMPLLWAIRDVVGLTGTKFGCGIAQCGACTVHVDGKPVRSCVMPVSLVGDRPVTTVEGVGDTAAGKAVQAAWLDLEVVQ